MRKFALLLVSLAPALFGQCEQIGIPTLSKIQGYVIDTNLNPIESVGVEVYSTKPDQRVDSLLGTVKTDRKGHFSFKRRTKKDKELFELRLTVNGRKLKGIRMEMGGPEIARSGGLNNLQLTVGEGECPDVSLAP
jgi:hypothetical protein